MNFPVLKTTVAYARGTRRGAGQGRRLQPHHQRHAAAAGRHRLPGRRAHRRDHLDRRPAGDPGQVPRLQQRQGQLRHRRRRRSRRCWPGTRPRPIGARVTLTQQTLDVKRIYRHLTTSIGFWEVGFAPVTTAPQRDYAIERRRLRPPARRSSARWPQEFLRGVAAEPAPRLLERARDAAGDPQGPRQGVSVRRRPRPAGRRHRRRRVAVPSLRRLRRAQLRLGAPRASTAAKQASFLEAHHIAHKTDCSQLLGAADLRRRLLSRGAHALRRHDRGRTCTTASGFAAGPTPASRSTASWP